MASAALLVAQTHPGQVDLGRWEVKEEVAMATFPEHQDQGRFQLSFLTILLLLRTALGLSQPSTHPLSPLEPAHQALKRNKRWEGRRYLCTPE